jgi:uncharacterized membrane protein YeaQ/YmgE (transglycosylase-associated protein family)
MPSLAQLIVWIVVGLIAGTVVGRLIAWDRRGFGFWGNLLLGLIGAVVGGLAFRLFGLFPSLASVAISLRDIVAAFAGSFVVLAGLWFWQRTRGSR